MQPQSYPMTTGDRSLDYERYAVIAAIVLLVLGCYLVVRPFLTAFLWGGIIALSTQGLFGHVLRLVGGRRRLAATLTSLLLALILLVPIAAFAIQVAAGLPEIGARLNDMFSAGLGQPPAWLSAIPLIGTKASGWWQSMAADPEQLLGVLRPLVRPLTDFLLAAGGGISGGILEFTLALVIATLLYVRGAALGAGIDRSLCVWGARPARGKSPSSRPRCAACSADCSGPAPSRRFWPSSGSGWRVSRARFCWGWARFSCPSCRAVPSFSGCRPLSG